MVREKYWKNKVKSVLSDYRKGEYARLKRYSKIVEGHIQIDEEELENKLREKGFKEIGTSIWVNKEKDVVIKYNGLVDDNETDFAIPTVNLGQILIQPIARVNRRKRGSDPFDKKNDQAYQILKRITVPESIDLHDDNVGWWKGVPVLVDW